MRQYRGFVFAWFCVLMLKEDFEVQVADSNCVKTIDEACEPEGKLTLATPSTKGVQGP